MTFCGFNNDMLDGLRLFAQGLWEQAERRVREDGILLPQAIENELNELSAFLAELATLPQDSRTMAITGAALFARYLYEGARGTDAKTMEKQYLERAEQFIQFLREMDDIYYNELLPGSTQSAALKQIAVWISSH